jgi:multidrug efflux pump
VAKVELGSRERRAWYRTNGQSQVGLGIVKTSTAKDLAVAEAVKKEVAEINKTLPSGMQIASPTTATVFIDVAVHEVYKTLAEAIALVLLVIWLFLGSARSALVPAVTVPVCVMAAFMPLLLFGFSINLLTLLALVLSHRLVVDDAIVVLENIQRRADLGEPAPLAAFARHAPGRLRGAGDHRGAGRGVSCRSRSLKATTAGCSANWRLRSQVRWRSPVRRAHS